MKILLAAATEPEIAPALLYLQSGLVNTYDIDVCITGVGLMAATFSLTRKMEGESYDLVLQAGIAGAFDKGLYLGSVVMVKSEQLGDLGAEDGDGFLDIFNLGFEDQDSPPFSRGRLINDYSGSPFPTAHMQKVNGLTVHTVSGTETTIQKRVQMYAADIESMEGAALHYVCLRLGIPFLQIRAISNYVTRRDRNAWKIGDAVAALNAQLIQWLG
jgi:futalosine hydrolase